MTAQTQIIIIFFSLAVLLFVFRLLRHHLISETVTLWWLFIVAAIISLTINNTLLLSLTKFIGAELPISALIFFSLAYVLVMLVYFSMKVSILSVQVKEIAQCLALLENRFKNRDKRNNG